MRHKLPKEMHMNVLKNNKAALLAIAFGVALLTGCGIGKEKWEAPHPIVDGDWNPEASAYFNKNVPQLNNLPGDVFHFQVIKREGGRNGVTDSDYDTYKMTVYIDGKVADHSVVPLQEIRSATGTRIRWVRGEGYSVGYNHESSLSTSGILEEMYLEKLNNKGYFRINRFF